MMQGMTRSGSAAANGMAPSVMPTHPMARAAAPASRSLSVHSRLADQRRQPSPIGGMQMAVATAPMTA